MDQMTAADNIHGLRHDMVCSISLISFQRCYTPDQLKFMLDG